MKLLLRFASIIILCSYSIASNADNSIVVVANTNHVNLTLSKQEVRNLFMGGYVGYDFTVVELLEPSKIRIVFNIKVVGLTEARIQSYWAQMRFSGRKKPPKQLKDAEAVLAFLQENDGAVAYLPADEPIPSGLKVLYASE